MAAESTGRGRMLAMRGVDVVTIQKAMGHSTLATTSRYLHARPAAEQAQVFTAALCLTCRTARWSIASRPDPRRRTFATAPRAH